MKRGPNPVWVYNIRDLPPDCLTQKGREQIESRKR